MRPAANPVKEYFANIWHTAYSVFEGMAVTLSYLGRKPTTIQWPDRMEDNRPVEEQLPERYRGILEVDMGKCNACLTCERDCPIDCIVIEVKKDPETKKRYMTRFAIDTAKCMYCALCTEGCPNRAIYHTTEFAHSTPDINDLVLEFVDEPQEVVKIKKGEEPEGIVKKPGDKVRELLAEKGVHGRWRPVPAPVAKRFSDRIAYHGQPNLEELKRRAQNFANSHMPKAKPKPKAKPAAKAEKTPAETPTAEASENDPPKADVAKPAAPTVEQTTNETPKIDSEKSEKAQTGAPNPEDQNQSGDL